MRRGYSSQEKSGSGIEAWDSCCNGVEAYSDGWSKTGFSSNDEGYLDHACRPLIIGVEVTKKRSLIFCIPSQKTDGFVTKTETLVEPVRNSGNGYINSSRTTMGPSKDYGIINSGWSRPLSPPHDQPPIVDEFISNNQTEVSQPKRAGILSSTYWRPTPSPNSYSSTNGYVGLSDTGTNGSNRPSGNTIRPLETVPNGVQEPTMISTGSWFGPSSAGWAAPPSYDIPPTKATATSSPSATTFKTHQQIPVPPPAGPKVNTFVQSIDSNEAALRYGGISVPTQTVQTANNHKSIIDSKEAVQKYGGVLIPKSYSK